MTETERRAIVWETIERLAFKPSDKAKWLGLYARTLPLFWGKEARYQGKKAKYLGTSGSDVIDIPNLALKCEYTIDSVEKYSFTLHDSSTSHSYWKNHVDPAYISKASLGFASGAYPNEKKETLQADIKAVLDGMLFHPRCHAHIEYFGDRPVQLDEEAGGLPSSEVRIGGGVENPYIFLFHLRYQFCLVANRAREDERQRLVDLFESAISDEKPSVIINARDLFNFVR